MSPIEAILADAGKARRLYLSINLGLALLVLMLVVWPLLGLLLDQRSEIAGAEAQLKAASALAQRADGLLLEQARLAALGGLPDDYLPGENHGLAAANLQGLMSQRVAAVGGRLVSTRILTADNDGDRRVVARLDAVVSHDQLRLLLHAVEGGQPRLVITGMSLAAAGEGTDRLTLALTVVGLRLPEGGEG
jgi:hypothetical protein